MNTATIDNMGKTELRAACKSAGIPYGKLNNEGMREALKAKQSVKPVASKTPVEQAVKEAIAEKDTPAQRAVSALTPKSGLKIEKDREERNGVKRPSVGGTCRAVWDALDRIGKTATAKDVKALAEKQGWNANNTSIEFYQWRKFNGITGRQKA